MRYVMSDVHGEYELFVKLLEKIKFSERDELYIAGDIIEKGHSSVKLARLIFSMPNVHVVMGNHEDAFLKFYDFRMRECGGDCERVMDDLRDYFISSGGDGEFLNWDVVDKIESLPYYIESADFICIHAGVPLDDEGRVPRLDSVATEELVCNRRFKNPDVIPQNSKCVFFGHTATSAVCGENKIIGYKKENSNFGDIRDYAKIHLDTCTFVSGVLGCFCVDTLRVAYVKRA